MNSKKTTFYAALLFSIMLVFSSLTITSLKVSPYVTGTSDKVVVNNETKLRNAINDAPSGRSVTIALGNDITLTGSTLDIPAGKDITLTSNKANGYYKLTSTVTEVSPVIVGDVSVSVSTITVNGNGMLKLDGINVTHDYNWGTHVVTVNENGRFIMYKGLISSNIGGVANRGIFEMYGGEISGGSVMTGGGVVNWGVFRMFGGTITGNTATEGGGVCNTRDGVFEMSGGTITGNSADRGGGVDNWGSFTMSGGTITDNLGGWGGGVGNMGLFIMKDGIISDNTAWHMGGGVNNGGSYRNWVNRQANFEMSGGEISGNVVDRQYVGDVPEKGGGVYNSPVSTFSLSGTGVISNNRAANLGGGVCTDGDFTMVNGTISDNSASRGGGLYIGSGEIRLSGGKVLGNTAKMGNNVYNENGNLVLSDDISTDKIILKYRDMYVLIVIAIVISCVIVSGLVYFRKRKNVGKNSKQRDAQVMH